MRPQKGESVIVMKIFCALLVASILSLSAAAAGPVGRDTQASVTPTAAIYTYSRSKGLFAGASLEGAVIATQKEANARYYGRSVRAIDILRGGVAAPAKAHVLRAALGR